MASESANFSEAIWQEYAAAPSFTLSSGNGTKTVYFKVKNVDCESLAVSDTITLDETVKGCGSCGPSGDVPMSKDYSGDFLVLVLMTLLLAISRRRTVRQQ
jgi:hypothetical protein